MVVDNYKDGVRAPQRKVRGGGVDIRLVEGGVFVHSDPDGTE